MRRATAPERGGVGEVEDRQPARYQELAAEISSSQNAGIGRLLDVGRTLG